MLMVSSVIVLDRVYDASEAGCAFLLVVTMIDVIKKRMAMIVPILPSTVKMVLSNIAGHGPLPNY